MHGEPSKWVRMEIIGDSDVAVSGEAHIESIDESGDTWKISGEVKVYFIIHMQNLIC